MESYVLRIYRRDGEGRLTGLVERVETQERLAFHSARELWSILHNHALARKKSRRRKSA